MPATNPPQERSRLTWTTSMERALLEGLKSALQQGLDSSNCNFTPQGWAKAIAAVRKVSGGQVITREKCDNRWRKFKRGWRLWAIHRRRVSSWTWDSGRQTFVTDQEVMDVYFYNHPEMLVFRQHGPTHQILLQELLDGRLATGEHARGKSSFLPQSIAPEGCPVPIDEEPVHQSTESPSPMQETSRFETGSPSPIIGRKRPASMLIERQTLEREDSEEFSDSETLEGQNDAIIRLAKSIRQIGEQMVISSSLVSEGKKSVSLQAMQAFVAEADDILPEEWKEGGEVPFSRMNSMLNLLGEKENAETYLALLCGRKEYRLGWIKHKLRKNGEDAEVV